MDEKTLDLEKRKSNLRLRKEILEKRLRKNAEEKTTLNRDCEALRKEFEQESSIQKLSCAVDELRAELKPQSPRMVRMSRPSCDGTNIG